MDKIQSAIRTINAILNFEKKLFIWLINPVNPEASAIGLNTACAAPFATPTTSFVVSAAA